MGGSFAQESGRKFAFALPPSPSASDFSSASSPTADQAFEKRIPLPSPMTSYEKGYPVVMSVERSSEGRGRTDSVGSGSRQQLPSLTSLFGPPTSRPLNSPVSDRPSGYAATSPLDRPRLGNDRGPPTSYFPQATSPPMSQPRSSYEPDRQAVTSHAYSGPQSPRYPDLPSARPQSRSDVEVGKWHDTGRHEYALGSREPNFRSPRDQFHLQFSGQREQGGYPEQRTDGPKAPPTPTSTIVSEGVTSKDGLGPKIWTGTHFLPRFVRAAEVPGEGLCYFYDDGTHCKTVIDGEAVNAHWGVTKAGKPRKRLAIACVTCREKKIKCDPDFPRCVQCEKFGRVCRFKNAPRGGGHNTEPSTPPADVDEHRRLGGLRTNELRFEGDSGSPVSPRAVVHHESPEAGGHKRLKVGPDSYVPNGEVSATMMRSLNHSKGQVVMARPNPDPSHMSEDILTRAWRTDPYASDPQSILSAVSQFFALTDSSMILRFLPEETFKNWLATSTHRKSAEDLMLLYSMLAIGVTLSGGPKDIANEYAQVAHHAQKTTAVNCLQLAQSRILLAMYYVSNSRLCEANELMSGAAGTMACIQLNFELDKSREAGLPFYPFGMNKETYTEARRRTFWSLYMLERLNGMFPDRLAFINAEDVYTRLPADTKSFEKQIETHMPAFDPYELNIPNMAEQPVEIGPYLVEMVHIWATCQAGVYRLARRPINTEVETAKVQSLTRRIEEWQAALPGQFVFSSANLEAASTTRNTGSFLMMHLMFHHAMIKLNRYRQNASELLTRDRAMLQERCREHALKIVDVAKSLDRLMSLRPIVLKTPPPTMAVALTEAIDVLTATGSIRQCGELIENTRLAKSIIDHVGSIWEEARKSKAQVEARLEKLDQIVRQGSRPGSPTNGYRVLTAIDQRELRWEFTEPFERLYKIETDVIYCPLE